VAIRPEDLSVESLGANVIAGRVDNVQYYGHDSLIDVVTPSGLLLHARTPVGSSIGETIKLAIAPERVLVFAPESA